MSDQVEFEAYELVLTGNGLSVKRTVDAATANAIVNIVMGGTPATLAGSTRSAAPTPHADAPRPARERLSLREYLETTGASRFPDKIVSIGAYLADHEEAETFTRDDIKSRFRSAGEAPPGNYSRDFALTISNGWVAEDSKSPGDYYITKKGRDVIAAGFAVEIKKAAKSRRRRSSQERSGSGEGDDK